jgi:hypothetical protein
MRFAEKMLQLPSFLAAKSLQSYIDQETQTLLQKTTKLPSFMDSKALLPYITQEIQDYTRG